MRKKTLVVIVFFVIMFGVMYVSLSVWEDKVQKRDISTHIVLLDKVAMWISTAPDSEIRNPENIQTLLNILQLSLETYEKYNAITPASGKKREMLIMWIGRIYSISMVFNKRTEKTHL